MLKNNCFMIYLFKKSNLLKNITKMLKISVFLDKKCIFKCHNPRSLVLTLIFWGFKKFLQMYTAIFIYIMSLNSLRKFMTNTI